MISLFKSNRILLGLGFSGLLLVLFFTTLDFKQLITALLGANYIYLIPSILFYFLGVLVRALRLQILLRPVKNLSIGRLYPVVVIGYMANNLLPLRLGELVRSYYLGEREGISKTVGLATILLERIFDALILLCFIAITAIFLPLAPILKGLGLSVGLPWILLTVTLSAPFLIVFGFLFILSKYPEQVQKLVLLLTSKLPLRISKASSELVGLFIYGLSTLKNPKQLPILVSLSIPIWLFEAMLFFLIFFSFGFQELFEGIWQMLLIAVLITSIANIGASLPSSPGGIGLFELFARESLVLLSIVGLDRASSGAYALTVHAALLIPVILLGQVFLITGDTSLTGLAKKTNIESNQID